MDVLPLGRQPYPAAGIHSIDHFALTVPDLDEAERFLNAFSLRTKRNPHDLEVRAHGDEHLWCRILQGKDPKKHLAYVSLGCYPSDIDTLRAQVESAGGSITAPASPALADGFWFRDIDGTLIQVKVALKTMPDSKAALTSEGCPAGSRGAPARSQAPGIEPTRLCHLALFTPSVSRAAEFYQRALGVVLADRSRDLIAFTYGRHGSDHHLLAFLGGGGPGLHHSSWDVGGISAIGLGAERLRGAGYTHQWGLGKHVLGSNFFNYTRDAWGTWWEHICHIDYIPRGASWEGGDYDEENGFYLWGPAVPADFGANTEA
jgi:catechol 2,3-dioxygenase-like lactoylglutathione lyase family enzyme